MKNINEIEEMILKHIEDIDKGVNEVKSKAVATYSPLSYAEMYKAKSIALQALAELINR